MFAQFKPQRLLVLLICLSLLYETPIPAVRAQEGDTISPFSDSVSSTATPPVHAERSTGVAQEEDTVPAARAGRLLGMIREVSAGGSHACAVTTTGGVKCWGNNLSGQLGDGTRAEQQRGPVDVVGLGSGVQAISAGDYHTCVVMTSGGVKCWGDNSTGQVGDGTVDTRRTPVDVVGLGSDIRAISAGSSHTCAVTVSGGVKCWGYNDHGQLGDGTVEYHRTTPVDVVGLSSGVWMISAGQHHTCAVTVSGGVKCWGWNSYGQVGDGTVNTRRRPVDVMGLGSGMQSVGAGDHHTCALTTAGSYTCWGSNSEWQFGDGTTESRLSPATGKWLGSGMQGISAHYRRTCAVTASSGVKCWGPNLGGGLGDGTAEPRSMPVDVVGLGSGVRAISAGGCAVMTSGGVKCWGDNSDGQLGDGTGRSRWTPVDVLAGVPDVVADNGFRLIPDGFKFANWGAIDYPLGIDLNRHDMFDLFGPDVCSSGASAETCVLEPTAQFWRQTMWKSMEGGHCAGMALGSQRVWAGYDSTETLQPQIITTYDLEPTDEVRAYVARNFVLQYLTPLAGTDTWRVRYGDGTTPNEVLALIRDNLQNHRNDPYYLGIRNAAGEGGHAVTPYRIADIGDGIFRVYIYDNNWPYRERFIVFDTHENSWEYDFGDYTPGAPKNIWSGDASTQTLRLRLTSGTEVIRWHCSFCRPRASAADAAQGSERLLFNATGESTLLLSSAAGERIGWDAPSGRYVNEVAGGVIHYTDGGLRTEISALIELPSGIYEAVIANPKSESQRVNISGIGAGYALGSQGVVLAPSSAQHYTMGADERLIRLKNAAGNSTPALFVLDDTGNSSYRVEITLNALAQGGEVELSYDRTGGHAHFRDTDAATNSYAISVIRTQRDGATEIFYNPAVDVSDTSLATAYVGAWDGEGALKVTVGTTTKMIPNRANTWLPVILR